MAIVLKKLQRSMNVIVPDAVSGVAEPRVSGASVIAPVCAPLVMAGAMLVPVTPVTVTATFCVVVPP